MWEHFLFKGWEVKFKHGLFVSDLYKIVINKNFIKIFCSVLKCILVHIKTQRQ